jgi:hypothetical protein
MKILEGGAYHNSLVHLNLCQFVTEPQTVGQLAGLLRKSGYVRFEGFDVPSAQDVIQFAVEVCVSLFNFSIVNLHGVSYMWILLERFSRSFATLCRVQDDNSENPNDQAQGRGECQMTKCQIGVEYPGIRVTHLTLLLSGLLACKLPCRGEQYAMGEADVVGTRRDQAFVHPVMAEVTFLGNISFGVEIDGIERALVHAGPASRAAVIVHHHNAVFPLCDGLFGTGLRARWILTVSAHIDPVDKVQPVVLLPGAVFGYVDQLHPFGRAHFLLACHLAGFASPARILLDYQCMFFFHFIPLFFSG